MVKLAGNSLITAVIESLAKAMALVRKFGLDAQTFLDFLTGSLFAAPIYRTYGSLIGADRFEPAGFKVPLGFKDNRLLLAAAEEAASPCPWPVSCTTASSPPWPRVSPNPIGRSSPASPTRTRASRTPPGNYRRPITDCRQPLPGLGLPRVSPRDPDG